MRKVLLLILVPLFALPVSAWAATATEQFAQMLDLLQKTPKDDALRENIVRFAVDMNPPPAVPEEARRALVGGNTALEEAAGLDDYARAAKHYEEAAALAPWWGAAYLNLARAQELQFDYRSAQRNLRLYMLTARSPEEARKAQDYLYALEDKQERADKSKNEYENKFGWVNGPWSVTRKLLDKSGLALAETDPVGTRPVVEGSRVMLKVSADTTEHDYRYGGDRAAPTRLEDSFRLSYDGSGQLVLEVFGNRDQYTCPVDYGWNEVEFELGADRRTITATREDLFAAPNCQPSGYSTVWVLQHQ
jgi:tetratricopeptide (TPR) repeat protein